MTNKETLQNDYLKALNDLDDKFKVVVSKNEFNEYANDDLPTSNTLEIPEPTTSSEVWDLLTNYYAAKNFERCKFDFCYQFSLTDQKEITDKIEALNKFIDAAMSINWHEAQPSTNMQSWIYCQLKKNYYKEIEIIKGQTIPCLHDASLEAIIYGEYFLFYEYLKAKVLTETKEAFEKVTPLIIEPNKEGDKMLFLFDLMFDGVDLNGWLLNYKSFGNLTIIEQSEKIWILKKLYGRKMPSVSLLKSFDNESGVLNNIATYHAKRTTAYIKTHSNNQSIAELTKALKIYDSNGIFEFDNEYYSKYLVSKERDVLMSTFYKNLVSQLEYIVNGGEKPLSMIEEEEALEKWHDKPSKNDEEKTPNIIETVQLLPPIENGKIKTGKPKILTTDLKNERNGKSESEQYIKEELIERLNKVENDMQPTIVAFSKIRCAAWVELLMDSNFFDSSFKIKHEKNCTDFAFYRYRINIFNQMKTGKDKDRNNHKSKLKRFLNRY